MYFEIQYQENTQNYAFYNKKHKCYLRVEDDDSDGGHELSCTTESPTFTGIRKRFEIIEHSTTSTDDSSSSVVELQSELLARDGYDDDCFQNDGKFVQCSKSKTSSSKLLMVSVDPYLTMFV